MMFGFCLKESDDHLTFEITHKLYSFLIFIRAMYSEKLISVNDIGRFTFQLYELTRWDFHSSGWLSRYAA